jgi:hypothetical protein
MQKKSIKGKKHNRHSVPKNAEKSIKGKKHNRHSVPKIDTQYMNRMVLSMY